MKLILAQPEHSKHIAAFYNAIHGSDFPHPELFDEETVARLLQDGELAMIVASKEQRIVGTGLAFPQAWNETLEIGALSVDDVPERNQVAKALFEALRRLGLKRYGIAYFRAPTEAAFRRGRDIGATCWGFRPMPGSRLISDAEMIMGFIDAKGGQGVRIRPPDNEITRLPFAARIIEALEQEADEIPYPKNFPVGSPRGTGTVVISGRIWPTYHSKGNYITLENSAGRYPVEIIREFVEKVREKGVTDIRMAVPVNHAEAYDDLLNLDFKPVAYLPGWFLRGPHRFDCIQMVAGMPRIPRITDDFIERATGKVVSELTP